MVTRVGISGGAALFALVGPSLVPLTAHAADYYAPPPVVEAPVVVEEPVIDTSGFYLRADVGYVFESETSGYYYGVDQPRVLAYHYDEIKLRESFNAAIGAGYRLNAFVRGDVTLDYFKTDLRGSASCFFATDCSYYDESKADIYVAMANAYVDIGTYGIVTPYLGAGVGVAKVDYGSMRNRFDCSGDLSPGYCGETRIHEGESSTRFAYALMAGLSLDITSNLFFDAGYKYTRIRGGEAFGYDAVDRGLGYRGTQGYDHGYDLHALRAGLRYEFGGYETAPIYQPLPVVETPPLIYK